MAVGDENNFRRRQYLLLALLLGDKSCFTAAGRLGPATAILIEAIGGLDLARVGAHAPRLATAAILHVFRLRLLRGSNLG